MDLHHFFSAVVTILCFAELVANSYAFVQSHACIIVQSACAYGWVINNNILKSHSNVCGIDDKL